MTTPATDTGAPIFKRLALLGIGLIGSSVARAARKHGLAAEIVGHSRRRETRDEAMALGFLDRVEADPAAAVAGADIVMICAPMGAYEQLAKAIAPALAPGAVVTDVGSVKGMVAKTIAPYLPAGVHLVPGHPIAGTEHSGPSAGFAELFIDRWCVLTPEPGVDPQAVAKVEALWRGMGMMVERMTAEHHDRVLAITSHIPHLIAYTIVGTASDMEEATQAEVIRFSAGGFRDFTRIAGSDPVMWRDVFLTNKDAVLEVLQQFTEDLVRLQRAIRRGEGDTLQSWFTRTRAIRRGVVDAHQEEMEPEKAARLTKEED
ncbi:MAG: prephenate/arogenate dehydrogenase family protein [Inquilinus limosus]|uniref:prephenate dehydrogenase n=1 Tax=Inquilinus limosus TaxID=171674 RepID=A0A952FMY1_9PROT|nr:prephenate/arogenate dehydrogenase family protein [Inquilinus limosus]